MLTRRSLFRLLTGAAISPALKPLAVLFPTLEGQKIAVQATGTVSYHTYLAGSDALCAADIRRCVASLQRANVLPMHPEKFVMYCHPSVAKDLGIRRLL